LRTCSSRPSVSRTTIPSPHARPVRPTRATSPPWSYCSADHGG
jgi:hypothetical protein